MNVSITNNSGITKTYLSGAVSIPNASTVSVIDPAIQLALSTDGALRADLLTSAVLISDGTNTFGGPDAIQYLYLIPNVVDALTYLVDMGGQNRNQVVTTTVAEALGGASRLSPRVFIQIHPIDGIVYWGFQNTVSASTGLPILRNQCKTFAFTDSVPIYLVSAGSVNVRIAEGR